MRYLCKNTDKPENEAIRKDRLARRAEQRRKTKRVFPPITKKIKTIGDYIAAWDSVNAFVPTGYASTFDPSRPWWPDGFNTETIDLVTEEHDHVAL
jgi:hypothetical protein